MTHVTGFLTPVPDGKRDLYVASVRAAWPFLRDYSAAEVMDAGGDAVPAGMQTGFRRAVDLQWGETACFSWMISPDKEAPDRGSASLQPDLRWQARKMPFDDRRMIWSGFRPTFQVDRRRDDR